MLVLICRTLLALRVIILVWLVILLTFFLFKPKKGGKHCNVQCKIGGGLYCKTRYVPESVKQTAKIAQPVEQTVSLTCPSDQVKTHLDFHACVHKLAARIFFRWEVNPAAGSRRTHVKVKKSFFSWLTILYKPCFIFKQVCLKSSRKPVRARVVDLKRKNTRASCDWLVSILLLVKNLLVHQDNYLDVAEVFLLLFAVSDALGINAVTHVTILSMKIVTWKKIEFYPLIERIVWAASPNA